eukprot:m.1012301 g.1012301  ORF g.1012301 m.1012301 type:complete len:965 (+) comp24066_c1_seq7:370-3264(+)
MMSKVDSLKLVHFNDVYNVTASKTANPCGGAARFVHKVKGILEESNQCKPIVVFSGDAFNPSLLSTVTKGEHMVPVLNALEIDAAVFGNHDFDFGLEQLSALKETCEFPWMMSNVLDVFTGANLGDGLTTIMLERGGRKIGFMGLIEKEWLSTLSTIDEEDTQYEDFVACARKLSVQLRAEGAEMIIAATHMRLANDKKLAEHVGSNTLDGIDLILGGHDHMYTVTEVNGVTIVKSGSDFRELTEVTLTFTGTRVAIGPCVRHRIERSMPEDADVQAAVAQFEASLAGQMSRVIGHTAVPLDARFAAIRTRETNVGNFVADCMRESCHADCALINSGTLRADCVFAPGPLTYRSITELVPMLDETCVVGLTGRQLIATLENGVSKYPKLEGRFPQVSGIWFEFDPRQPPGQRILHDSVRVGDVQHQLDPDREYHMATKAYLRFGKDGYDMLPEGRLIGDEESSPVLPTVIRNYFKMLQLLCEEGDTLNVRRTPSRRKQLKRFKDNLWKDGSQTKPLSLGEYDPTYGVNTSHDKTPVPTEVVTPSKEPELMTAFSENALSSGLGSTPEPDALAVPLTPEPVHAHCDAALCKHAPPAAVTIETFDSPKVILAKFDSPPPTPVAPIPPSQCEVCDTLYKIKPVVEGRIVNVDLKFATGVADFVDLYDGFILDQYGVLHNGGKPLPGALACFEMLRSKGKYVCINSNSTRSSTETLLRLATVHGFGGGVLDGCAAVTSGELSQQILARRWANQRVILFGTVGDERPDLSDLQLTYTTDPREADFVLTLGVGAITDDAGRVLLPNGDCETTGVVTEAVDDILRRAAKRKLPMLVINQDVLSRTADDVHRVYRPGCLGALYDALGGYTVRFGKPNQECFGECIRVLQQMGVTNTARIVHIGDSLVHDIGGAMRSGLSSVFVTGGVHAEDLAIVPGAVPAVATTLNLFRQHRVFPTHVIPSFQWRPPAHVP